MEHFKKVRQENMPTKIKQKQPEFISDLPTLTK